MQKSKTGLPKLAVYAGIACHVLWKYRRHLGYRFVRTSYLLLKSFYPNKLIKLNDSWKLHIYLPAYPSRAFFKAFEGKLLASEPAPVSTVLSITRKCQYKCPHCYQRLDRGSDIDAGKLIGVVRDLSQTGVTFLNVEGGDAFLRFDLLCDMLDSLDESMEVWVNTTGANTSREKFAELKEKGLCGVMVSIHHPDAARYDEFVGRPGAFELAKQALRWCDELGLGTAINCVLTIEDIRSGILADIMKLAEELGCGFVQLIHPKRAGKWLDNESVNRDDNEIVDYVTRAHRYYNKRRKGPALPAQAQEEHPDHFGCTCGGIERFYIGATGEVQPCEFLNVSFGNVNSEAFSDIYRRMRTAFGTPCREWMCQIHAASIHDFMEQNHLTETPVPWEYSQELIKTWKGGTPTKLYRKLKIYDGK